MSTINLIYANITKITILIINLMHLFNTKFFWFYSEYQILFNLIVYIFVGWILYYVTSKITHKILRVSIKIIATPFFVLLVILLLLTDTNNYLYKYDLNHGNYLMLVSYDSGAFSSSTMMNVELYEKCGPVYLITKIKSYENIKVGVINNAYEDNIQVTLKTYSNEKISDSISPSALSPHFNCLF